MPPPKRTWLWVILGVAGTIFLCVVLVMGSAIYMFRTHVKNEQVETTVAEQQFAQQREQFKGQQPLIEFTGNDRGDDDAVVHRPKPDAPRAHINRLRVLIYDLNQNHLIHVDVPGWLVRMMPEGGRFGGSFQGNDEFVRRRITVADIERHGYGLVLDGHNRNTRILVWSE